MKIILKLIILMTLVSSAWAASDEGSEYSQVVINEVELNPPGYDEDNEWAELYNNGGESVDISGWTLSATASSITLTIPSETVIPAKGFYVATCEGYWLYNSDEEVILETKEGLKVDRTPTFSDSRNDDLAWSRYPDGGDRWVYIESSRDSNVPSIIYSEDSIATTGKTKDKDWLKCCGSGYFSIDPADLRQWNVSEFFAS